MELPRPTPPLVHQDLGLFGSAEKTAERLALALSAADLGDWVWDASTDLVSLSERALEIFNLAPGKQLTRTAMRGLLHEADSERARVALEQAVQNRTDYQIEYRVRMPGGGFRWVAANGRAVYAEDGTLTAMLGVLQDITARKRDEEALRDARARVEATLVSAEIGTWTWDIAGDRVIGDKNLARMFSMAENASVEGNLEVFLARIHAEDRHRVQADIAAALGSAGGELETDFRLSSTDASVRWVTARGRVERNAQGFPAQCPGVLMDITERKRQEHELADLSRQIAKQAHLFQATLSHISDLAYTFDLEGRVIFANQPLLDLWGLSMEQAVGKNCFDLGYPTDLASRLHGELMEVIRTGKPRRGETEFTSAKGIVDIHEYIFNPVFDAQQRVVAVAGTTRLVTQRKQVEAALQEAKESAEAANRAKDRFLAVLSHELRTPLTPVLMTVAAMELDPDLPEIFREDIAMIRRNVELETKLIDDLLDLSRITSGKLALRLELLDLNEVLEQVCRICRPQILEKGIRLVRALDPQAGRVNADPARLQQILWNVLKNAVKFTPDGGLIEVSTQLSNDGRATVTVRDNGLGIPSEVLPRIFEAFEQGYKQITRQFGGLGLGLAISKALVELHHGSITARSEGSGLGATFTIALPFYAPAPPRSEPDNSPASATPAELRLLIVEDHADTARILARLLGLSGFVVRTAPNVATAMGLLYEHTFDILISDLGLPDATGFEFIQKVRALHPIPAIAMSGFGMDTDIRKSLDAGFSDHLVKPINVAELEAVIRRIAPPRQPPDFRPGD